MLFGDVVAKRPRPMKPMPPKEIPPYHVLLAVNAVHPLVRIYEAIFIVRLAGMERLEDDAVFMGEVGAHWSAYLDLTPENQEYFITNLPKSDSTTNSACLRWSLLRTGRHLETWDAPAACDGWRVTNEDGHDFEIVLCED